MKPACCPKTSILLTSVRCSCSSSRNADCVLTKKTTAQWRQTHTEMVTRQSRMQTEGMERWAALCIRRALQHLPWMIRWYEHTFKQFAQNLTTPYKYLQILQNSHFIISSSRVAEHPTMVSPASGSISLNKFIEICQIEARKNIWYLLQRTNLRLAHYEVIQTNDWINWSGVDCWQLCLSDAEPASSWSWESKIELKSKKTVMIHQHSHVFFFHAWDHGLAPQLRQLRIGLHLLRRSGSCAHHVMPICQIKDFQPFQFELFSWDISGCNKAKMEIS